MIILITKFPFGKIWCKTQKILQIRLNVNILYVIWMVTLEPDMKQWITSLWHQAEDSNWQQACITITKQVTYQLYMISIYCYMIGGLFWFKDVVSAFLLIRMVFKLTKTARQTVNHDYGTKTGRCHLHTYMGSSSPAQKYGAWIFNTWLKLDFLKST